MIIVKAMRGCLSSHHLGHCEFGNNQKRPTRGLKSPTLLVLRVGPLVRPIHCVRLLIMSKVKIVLVRSVLVLRSVSRIGVLRVW